MGAAYWVDSKKKKKEGRGSGYSEDRIYPDSTFLHSLVYISLSLYLGVAYVIPCLCELSRFRYNRAGKHRVDATRF